MSDLLVIKSLDLLIGDFLSDTRYSIARNTIRGMNNRIQKFKDNWDGDDLQYIYLNALRQATLTQGFKNLLHNEFRTESIEIDPQGLQEALQKLSISIDQTSLLNRTVYQTELHQKFVEYNVLTLNNHTLTDAEYAGLLQYLIRFADSEFKSLLIQDGRYILKALIAAVGDNATNLFKLEEIVTLLSIQQSDFENALELIKQEIGILQESGLLEAIEEFKRLKEIDPERITEVFNQTSKWLFQERNQIEGTSAGTISRSHTKEIWSWLSNGVTNDRLALLMGQPGSGKTIIMQQVANLLKNNDIPYLALRADAHHYDSIKNLSDLSRSINLPADLIHSVQLVTAEYGKCVLIIDQIDTLSSPMTGNAELVSVFIDLIYRLITIGNVYVIVPIRYVEQENDIQLSKLNSDLVFNVNSLSSTELDPILHELKLPTLDNLSDPLKELVQLPLHLNILARIKNKYPDKPLNYRHLHDLYSVLYEDQILGISNESDITAQAVLDALHLVTDEIKKRRIQEIPISILDRCPNPRNYLIREIILIQRENSIRFFHTTFFTYCYARFSISEEDSLADAIFDSPQFFFEPPFIRGVLSYLEIEDHERCIHEIRQLLFPSEERELRYHLHELIIKWLASRINPTNEQIGLYRDVTRSLEDHLLFIRAIQINSGWWDILNNHIPSWLSDDRTIELGFSLLYRFAGTETEEVIGYLLPFWDKNEEWNNRILWLSRHITDWQSAEPLALLIQESWMKAEQISVGETYILQNIAKTHPKMACVLLRTFLDTESSRLIKPKDSDTNVTRLDYKISHDINDILNNYNMQRLFDILTKIDPITFVNQMLAWYLEVIHHLLKLQPEEANSKPDFAYYPRLRIFERDLPNSGGITFGHAILKGFNHLFQNDVDQFVESAKMLENLNTLESQSLLVQIYIPCAHHFETKIFELFQQDKRRWRLFEVAPKLVAAVHQEGTKSQRLLWEQAVQEMPNVRQNNTDELQQKRAQMAKYERDQLQYLLLMDDDKLSEQALRYKQVLVRKYPNETPYLEPQINAVTVVSPVETDNLKAMSDHDVIQILQNYDRNKPGEFLKGGIDQIKHQIKQLAIENPERWYVLSLNFDQSIDLSYFLVILEVISERKEDILPVWLFEVTKRILEYHELEIHDRLQVIWALRRGIKSPLPEYLLTTVVAWMENDEDPSIDKSPRNYTSNRSLPELSLNSVRSMALDLLCLSYFHQSDFDAIFNLLTNRHDADPSDIVQFVIMQNLGKWHSETKARDKFVKFLKSLFEKHPALINTNYGFQLIHWLIQEVPDIGISFVLPLLDANEPYIQQFSSEMLARAAFKDTKYKDNLETIWNTGNIYFLQGIARACSIYVFQEQNRDECAQKLQSLMGDKNAEVRSKAVFWIRLLKPNHLLSFKDLIIEFIASASFEQGSYDLVQFLAHKEPRSTEENILTLDLIKQVLEHSRANLSDITQAPMFQENDMIAYIVSFANSADANLKIRAVEIFDILVKKNSSRARSIIQNEDQNWLW